MTGTRRNTETLWTAIDAAAATGGRARGGIWNATGVSIDSRSVSQGDLFVALVGSTHDAHDHLTQALENGAAAAVVSTVPARLADTAPLLIVDDTTAALEAKPPSAALPLIFDPFLLKVTLFVPKVPA